jgi:hypothetical protein
MITEHPDLPMKIYAPILVSGLLTACTPTSAPHLPRTAYRLALQPAYLQTAVSTYLRTAHLPKDSAFVRLVFFETISHQYTYFSASSLRPNYQLAQPEGWFIHEGVLVVVMQAGAFYRRNAQIEKEVDYQLDSLRVKLSSSDNAIVEPSGQRLIYCLRTKSSAWDDNFDKVADGECD